MDLLKTTIGIELGSTRIKAVMLDDKHNIISQGFYDWENKLINGVWTYDLEEVIFGLQSCYKDLSLNFEKTHGMKLTTTGAIGISGMMHGYLVFDKDNNQIGEFRTWRNTITKEAANILSNEFNFNIPQRWSVAFIYQAILNNELDVDKISFATTLSGYIHYKLTGKKVLGIGEASGMFPIDSDTLDYDKGMISKFEKLVSDRVPWKILDIIPKVLIAGCNAGYLTSEGARFLDPSGTLNPGIPLCPPEGDMQTGMVATNSVRANTGNCSLGTSSNVTIITNKKIGVYPQIDVIVSPSGINAALVHVNNGTSDINAWVNLFYEVCKLSGGNISKAELFEKLFKEALENINYDSGLVAYNYFSGEPIVNIYEGRPILVRDPSKSIGLSDFMRTHIFSLLATIRMGMEILTVNEAVNIDLITGHGGFFKTPVVGQKMLGASLNTDVEVVSTASEGGPYGMALLAGYLLYKDELEKLEDYLDNKVFKYVTKSIEYIDKDLVASFNVFYKRFVECLEIENVAIKLHKIND